MTRTAGQTIWATSAGSSPAGMAWDWIHLSRGIVVMADPLSVVTNLRLVNGEGEGLTMLETLRYLNEVVHSLAWQDEVERVMLISEQAA